MLFYLRDFRLVHVSPSIGMRVSLNFLPAMCRITRIVSARPRASQYISSYVSDMSCWFLNQRQIERNTSTDGCCIGPITTVLDRPPLIELTVTVDFNMYKVDSNYQEAYTCVGHDSVTCALYLNRNATEPMIFTVYRLTHSKRGQPKDLSRNIASV